MLIHHTFAPHVDSAFLRRTLALLLQPWKWKNGVAREELRTALVRRFHADVFLFSSGREALLALLRSLTDADGGEIIVQAYTCAVLPNAIAAAGMTPIYAEIERETLNIDCEALENVITPRTRAVICQHTFGIPADTERLREICDRHRLLLVEDCAHIIPDETGPEPIGKHGDCMLLSFGRDKAISGITGGAILMRRNEIMNQPFDSAQGRRNNEGMVQRLRSAEEQADSLSLLTIKRLLLYPIVYSIARPLYGIGIGKAFLVLSRWIGALVPILTREEKKGHMGMRLHKLPNACADLALASFRNLKKINDHRRALTRLYLEEGQRRGWFIPRSAEREGGSLLAGVTPDLPLQKFPIFVKNADGIRAALKKRNIHLDDGWTGCVVCPPSVDLDPMHYIPGSDPEAEAACEKILSLPTHPTMTREQAQELLKKLAPLLS